MSRFPYIILIIAIVLSDNCFSSSWQKQIIAQFNSAAIILQNPDGQIIFSHHADKSMVPASILKIATADAVITKLGKDYRIPTEFYLTEDYYLGIKGFGDPGLTSESLAAIARQLKSHLDTNTGTELKGFWLDKRCQ